VFGGLMYFCISVFLYFFVTEIFKAAKTSLEGAFVIV